MGGQAGNSVIGGKLLILLLGSISLGVGYYSHFSSDYWLDTRENRQQCALIKEQNPDSPACPSIVLEQFFIAISIISLGLSVLSLIASYLANQEKLKPLDTGYHFLFAALTIVAGVVIIVSAIQIDKLVKDFNGGEIPEGVKLLALHKIAAGVLAILQGFACGAVGFLVMKSS